MRNKYTNKKKSNSKSTNLPVNIYTWITFLYKFPNNFILFNQ